MEYDWQTERKKLTQRGELKTKEKCGKKLNDLEIAVAKIELRSL